MEPARINAKLQEPLAEHVARVVRPKGLYVTPSGYIPHSSVAIWKAKPFKHTQKF